MQEVARDQESAFDRAVRFMEAMAPAPRLYDAYGRPLKKQAGYTYRRTAGKKTGSQKNWT